VLWGLGALGSQVLKAAVGVHSISVVGVIDHNPGYAGKEVGSVFPETRGLGFKIEPTLDACLAGLSAPAEIVFHMTESFMPRIQDQLELALSRRLNVISAAESMFHPALRHPEAAARLNRVAMEKGVRITGCGINPGFVFDSLVLALARVSTAITGITASRVVDVTAGPDDLNHVGIGLWPDEFRTKLAAGRVVGHMGFPESIAAVAEHVGLPLDHIEQSWRPRTSPLPVESSLGILEPGKVTGIDQEGKGFVGEREAITMRFTAQYKPEQHGLVQMDQITIEGRHRVHATVSPSSASTLGAALMMINAANELCELAPGLHSVLSLSLGGALREGFRLALDPSRAASPERIWLVRRNAGFV